MLPRKVNIILVIVAMLAILVYVMLSNIFVSQKYLLNSLKAEFDRESIQSVNVNSEPDIETLINFAKTAGMVEAEDTSTILMDSAFALEN